MHRVRIVLAGITAMVLLALGNPAAFAADTQPKLGLAQSGDTVVAIGSGFTDGAKASVEAVVTGGKGSATRTVDGNGSFVVGFGLPKGFAGSIRVVATAGEEKATATLTATASDEAAPVLTTPRSIPAAVGPVAGIDVTTLGAKGDGTTDDTAALQAALDGLTVNQTLVLPANKTFVQSKTLTVKNDGVHISGPGTLLATNDADSSFWIKGKNVTVDGGLVFKSNAKTRGGAWEHYRVVLWSSGTTLRNITVDGSHAAGIFMDGASDFLLDTVLVENTMADGIHNTGGSHDGVIRNATVKNVGDDGIAVVSYVGDHPPVKNITVENPKIYRPSAPGRSLSVVGGENITFSNIYVEDSSAASIYISAEKEWNTTSVKNVKVLGGTIKNANWYATNDHGAILVYNSQTGGTISDVTFDGLKTDTTRAGAGWNMAILDFGKGTSGVTFSNIAITGTPNAFKLDGNPSAGYLFDNVTLNGATVTP